MMIDGDLNNPICVELANFKKKMPSAKCNILIILCEMSFSNSKSKIL